MYEELTLMSEEEICNSGALRGFSIYPNSPSTDLVILTGGKYVTKDVGFFNITSPYYTNTITSYHGKDGYVVYINEYGTAILDDGFSKDFAIRPIWHSPKLFQKLAKDRDYMSKDKPRCCYGIVEYGYFPQYAAPYYMQKILESEYLKSENGTLKMTDRKYTLYELGNLAGDVEKIHFEFEYNGKGYIRAKASSDCADKFILSNGVEYSKDDYIWVEVSPVEWLYDCYTETLISTRCLLSGLRFYTKSNEWVTAKMAASKMGFEIQQVAPFTRVETVAQDRKKM